MPEIAQTTNNTDMVIRAGLRIRCGERLTISGRTITKVAFLLRRVLAPTGDVTFIVRKVSDDSVIVSKVLKDAGLLQAADAWEEVTFDTPTYVNAEVRLSCEYGGGDGSNYVVFRYQNTDVLASAIITYYPASSWTDNAAFDAAFKYTYELPATVGKTAHMADKVVAARII